MDNIKLEGTDRHPAINFDFSANHFSISGFSYPENVKVFYGPPVEKLTQHLESLEDASLHFEFAFNYFHSSTAQVLYGLFDAIEKCAAHGNTILITWCYETDDDSMLEAGEDWAEEVELATFKLKEI